MWSTLGQIAPGSVIGTLGGGQLAKMLFLRGAYPLGYRGAVLDPDPAAPAMQIATHPIVSHYDNPFGLTELARESHVITFEFENVPASSIDHIEAGAPTVIRPPKQSLAIAQRRSLEKKLMERLRIEVAPWCCVESAADLTGLINGPAILKSESGGYDGKNQWPIGSPEDVELAKGLLGDGRTFVLEERVPFDFEVCLIVARWPNGNLLYFPLVETVHEKGILRQTHWPSPKVSERPYLCPMAQSIAARIAHELGHVGLLAVEMFVVSDRLIVNEIAPRPHNSGHWTNFCGGCSQFEAHVRAVCDLPVPRFEPSHAVTMRNLLGSEIDGWIGYMADPDTQVEVYGKAEARAGRKMGHVNQRRLLTIDELRQFEELESLTA